MIPCATIRRKAIHASDCLRYIAGGRRAVALIETRSVSEDEVPQRRALAHASGCDAKKPPSHAGRRRGGRGGVRLARRSQAIAPAVAATATAA